MTPIRLMNDLHDKQYREAFEKRLAEEVDYKAIHSIQMPKRRRVGL